MADALHTVIETPAFQADAKRSGIEDDERQAMVDWIASNPSTGDLIPGTGGARKVRFAGRGKGKSGAYRVITYYADVDVPVFLLNVFSKGERVDLSQSERNQLKSVLSELADVYRRGVKRSVKSR